MEVVSCAYLRLCKDGMWAHPDNNAQWTVCYTEGVWQNEDRFEVRGVVGDFQISRRMFKVLYSGSNRGTIKCGWWWTLFVPGYLRLGTQWKWPAVGHYLSCLQTHTKAKSAAWKTTLYRLLLVVCWTCTVTEGSLFNTNLKYS
jgi:hypothetical protein